MTFFSDYVNIKIDRLDLLLMNQGRKQKFMEDSGLGSQKWLNPQCFPQNMRKGYQSPFTSCEPTPKALTQSFLAGEWISRQAKNADRTESQLSRAAGTSSLEIHVSRISSVIPNFERCSVAMRMLWPSSRQMRSRRFQVLMT